MLDLRSPLVPAFAALLLLAGGTSLEAQAEKNKGSPFLPPASETRAPTVVGPHEFSGVIVGAKQTLVSITQTEQKRSVWIAVGKSAEGIEVLTHDPKTNQVSIRVGGETKTLTLKQPVIAASAPSGTTAALGGSIAAISQIPLPPLVTREEQEREARMLVSDLLEIGMQQRKAYEEAQRKAALEAAAKAPSTKP